MAADVVYNIRLSNIPDLTSTIKHEGARNFGRVKPHTVYWLAQQMQRDPLHGLICLRCWTHQQKQKECTPEKVQEINEMMDMQAIHTLIELREPKKYIRRVSGRQMDIQLTATTLDTGRTYGVKALLDSGSTGSCIDQKFVKENRINTNKYPTPIPVYNADGTRNQAGPITEYVDMRIQIKDHIERLHWAVTDLGKATIFIGYEWLTRHNPRIDWTKETIGFDRCPEECLRSIDWSSPEEHGMIFTREIDFDIGE